MEASRRQFIQTCLAVGSAGSLLQLGGGCRNSLTDVASASAEGQGDRAAEGTDAGRFSPAYLKLHRDGELKRRGESLWKRMSPCKLCPRTCGVDRPAGERGFCNAPSELVISSYHPHFGEERPLVGRGGSGTVFFSHCSLRCVFCINYDISLEGKGHCRSIEDLADMMVRLQATGCHNINVVTPTHYSPHIVLALDIACGRGLRLPLVYNTCGWEQLEILRLLDGIVDIYLPDFKYAAGAMAAKYSSCSPPDPKFSQSAAGQRYTSSEIYPEMTQMALLEMHRQVGVAKPAPDGLMYRGLMIRHLVMPNNVGGSKDVVRWIARNLPKDTYVNIMSQYRPEYRAREHPAIARPITADEYREVVETAKAEGLTNLDVQGQWWFF